MTINAISEKKSPALPSRKKKEENAIIVVRTALTTDGITSTVPSNAALRRGFPLSK
jgi:hypothetical protein